MIAFAQFFDDLGRRHFARAVQRPQRKQLPERGPQAVNVGAAIDRVLGRQLADTDLLGARVTQRRPAAGASGGLRLFVGELRQAEIGEDHATPVGRNQQVGGFYISMDDTFGV